MYRAIACLLGMVFILPLTGGCGADLEYVLPVIAGQASILLHSVPISDAIRSGTLSDEQVAKLILIRDVRQYAGWEMGLNTTNNYTHFYDSRNSPIAYNISASHRYEFHPKKWEFPIVGVLPYVGFFDKAAAVRQFDALAADGYDVFMYEVDAYSTLDYLPNPIMSPMLERSDLSLIETGIHELLHSTVWHPSDTTFNESLATFVGRTGAVEYLAARYPDEPQRTQEAIEHYKDNSLYNAFIFELYGELEAFYAGDLSREEKIAGREAVYQAGRQRFTAECQPLMNSPQDFAWAAELPTNNAWMLANYRYNYDFETFEQVYQATGQVWRQAISVFRDAAHADDPNAYLRKWLSGVVGRVSPAAAGKAGKTRPTARQSPHNETERSNAGSDTSLEHTA
ncbi:MAG: aminopeptidase [Phycisphaerae bacterium]|nr:aminopeptidase [Phycisphaerae bacterium]